MRSAASQVPRFPTSPLRIHGCQALALVGVVRKRMRESSEACLHGTMTPSARHRVFDAGLTDGPPSGNISSSPLQGPQSDPMALLLGRRSASESSTRPRLYDRRRSKTPGTSSGAMSVSMTAPIHHRANSFVASRTRNSTMDCGRLGARLGSRIGRRMAAELV